MNGVDRRLITVQNEHGPRVGSAEAAEVVTNRRHVVRAMGGVSAPILHPSGRNARGVS